jgi:predicted GTPase
MKQMLRRYWQELAMLLLIAAPILTLIIAGTLSIVHSQWFFEVFGVMTVCGLAAAALGRSVRSAARQKTASLRDSEGAWTPVEEAAWKAVEALAVKAQTTPPSDVAALKSLTTNVINTVASNLHADAKFAWARFTVPELLLAVEQASQRLRTTLHLRVPGSQSLTASHVLWAHHLYTAHNTKVQLAFWAYRMFRIARSPVISLGQELKDHFGNNATKVGFDVAHGWMSRLLTEELGRSAIDLYSGRMRRSTSQALLALKEAAPVERGPVPVRILIAGQVNSGKSSLLNALRGSVQARVSELPTSDGMKEFRFKEGDNFDLTIIDTPGVVSAEVADHALTLACRNADLIIWVAQANQPARKPDVVALSAIRKWFGENPHVAPPTIVMAVTHIDRLKPFREWSPPYDIGNPQREKARQIRAALVDIGLVLSAPEEALIPVSLIEGEPSYNVDALWAVISRRMNGATQAALARALKKDIPLRLSELARQFYEGGLFIVNRL